MKRSILFAAFLVSALSMMAEAWQHTFTSKNYYTINRYDKDVGYMYSSGTSILANSFNGTDPAFMWSLEPADSTECYYIRNAKNGLYVQSTNITLSSAVQLGPDKVRFYISRGAGTTGTNTYFLCSTDQKISYLTDGTKGLNYQTNKTIVSYYIKTGRGNSYFRITETEYDEESIKEAQKDVCPSVTAYRVPCCKLSADTYLTSLDIHGTGVLEELHYTATAAPSRAYNNYKMKNAVVAPEGQITVSGTLAGAQTEGLDLTVWADLDADAQFESPVKVSLDGDAFTAQFTVPAQQKNVTGRLRIRVDQSGGEQSYDDIVGTCYDFPVLFGPASESRTLSVSAPEGRGSVCIKDCEATTLTTQQGTEVTVVATPWGDATFKEWRDGRVVVSTSATYTFPLGGNQNLKAIFTPNTQGTTAVTTVAAPVAQPQVSKVFENGQVLIHKDGQTYHTSGVVKK